MENPGNLQIWLQNDSHITLPQGKLLTARVGTDRAARVGSTENFSMRSLVQFGVSIMCIGLVGLGLYMSLAPVGQDIVLDRPGTPGRLVADTSTATAFFEMNGEQMELTMLFSDPGEPDSVFRTRVVLANGQSHSIVVANSEDGSDAQRFVFLRNGTTVTMSLDDSTPRTASFQTRN